MSNSKFLLALILAPLTSITACGQNTKTEQLAEPKTTSSTEPHRYGGWYCPDNFGFVPVDIQNLNEVPAIADRLPTEEELKAHMSLINVDTEKYPDARALKMDLPRVASIYVEHKRMTELIIVIQAIVVQEDTVVGYRFTNGGNGSTWLRDVHFLSEDELAEQGPQPFFFSESVLKASTADIWKALGETAYFKQLGKKFDKEAFFSTAWNPDSEASLKLDTDGEKASGYVGMVFGNYYLHIDYDKNGSHYSEKMLMIANEEDNTTEFYFASGPYPQNFEHQKTNLESWIKSVKTDSEKK